tara:strand:+ start:543 stop:716 length:174 start_codon:yes stop_codon:yes gene_type:complete
MTVGRTRKNINLVGSGISVPAGTTKKRKIKAKAKSGGRTITSGRLRVKGRKVARKSR